MKIALYRFKKLNPIKVAVGASVALLGFAGNANAVTLTLNNPYTKQADVDKFLFGESSQYLLIGNGGVNENNGQPGVGDAVNMNNFELGANKAPTPSISGFGDDSVNASSLHGNVLDIPEIAQEVGTGIGGHGNIAITNSDGTFNLQDVGVYADENIGIRTAQAIKDSDSGTQNSFFNDPENFPNTFEKDTRINIGVGSNNTYGDGVNVNPGDADQSTSIGTDRGLRKENDNDANRSEVGLTGNYDFTDLNNEVFDGPSSAFQMIPQMASTGTLYLESGTIQQDERVRFGRNHNSSAGTLVKSDATKRKSEDAPYNERETVDGGNYTLSLSKGLHIIDIDANDNDFKLDNVNFIIDSTSDNPNDTFVIFRLDENMLISNSNVLAGNNIGLNNVLFFSDKADNNQHFNFSNTVINGAAFWTTAETGGEINVDNSQGCTQLVADKITLNDVRYNRCSFSTKLYEEFTYEPPARVPEPGSVMALAFIGGGIFLTRRRQSK